MWAHLSVLKLKLLLVLAHRTSTCNQEWINIQFKPELHCATSIQTWIKLVWEASWSVLNALDLVLNKSIHLNCPAANLTLRNWETWPCHGTFNLYLHMMAWRWLGHSANETDIQPCRMSKNVEGVRVCVCVKPKVMKRANDKPLHFL